MATTSRGATLHILDEHVHSAAQVYPTLAGGVTAIAGAAWTLGAFVEVVPVNTITEEFDIHYISIENLSANETYELHLFQGASDVFVGSVRLVQNAIQDGTQNVPFMTLRIAANARIRAKLATAGGGDTCTFTIGYHIY